MMDKSDSDVEEFLIEVKMHIDNAYKLMKSDALLNDCIDFLKMEADAATKEDVIFYNSIFKAISQRNKDKRVDHPFSNPFTMLAVQFAVLSMIEIHDAVKIFPKSQAEDRINKILPIVPAIATCVYILQSAMFRNHINGVFDATKIKDKAKDTR